jgi:TetR/AcrR family fatty acid metabolism transcriptional regulator
MKDQSKTRKPYNQAIKPKKFPLGRTKIVEAIRSLLETESFGEISTASIAKTAGVTEPLIYKYFKDKRDLLHQITADYNETFLYHLETDLKGVSGSLNKLRKLIWSTINCYATNRIYAKVLLLELRSFPGYFNSDAYEGIREFGSVILDIIEEGIDSGEIREDFPSKFIRQSILGCIEHQCLPGIIFSQEIEPDKLTEQICDMIFSGIQRH